MHWFAAIDLIADEFVSRDIDLVAGIDARGFILAAPIARRLGCGFIPIRKTSKLPYKTYRIDYDLEYGSGSLEVHQDAARAGQRVVIIDDVLATGGTSRASAELIERTGAIVAAFGFLASIEGLNGADLISDYDSVIALGAV